MIELIFGNSHGLSPTKQRSARNCCFLTSSEGSEILIFRTRLQNLLLKPK